MGGRLLLIPIYREAGCTILEVRKPRKFEIAQDELTMLRQYVKYLEDPRLVICHHGASPIEVDRLQRCLENPQDYFNTRNGWRCGRLDLLLPRLFAYFRVIPREVEGLKPLADEIRHFGHIRMLVRDPCEPLEAAITRVREAPRRLHELRERYEAGQLAFEEMIH